jgi:magnesium transporter
MTRKGGERMDVLLVCDEGVERHAIEDLPRLLDRRDAVVWVDIPVCDEQAVNVLSGVFGKGGHVHYVELDQFVGQNYLVTVHAR